MKVEPTWEPVAPLAGARWPSAGFLDIPESSVLPPKKVIELSDDESKSLVVSRVVASCAIPTEASPSAPRVAAVPDTSGDKAFARALFIELNREAIGIPGDGALIDLVSDEEDYGASSGDKEEGGVTPGEEKEEAASGDGLESQVAVPPSPPPSTRGVLMTTRLVRRRRFCPSRRTHCSCRSSTA